MIFSIDLIQYKMKLLRFKVFHAICMHQFGWLSNFLNLLQKEEVPRTGEVPQKGGGGFNQGGNCDTIPYMGNNRFCV